MTSRGLPSPHRWIRGSHGGGHLHHLPLHLLNLLQEHQDAPLQLEKPQFQHSKRQRGSQRLGSAVPHEQTALAEQLPIAQKLQLTTLNEVHLAAMDSLFKITQTAGSHWTVWKSLLCLHKSHTLLSLHQLSYIKVYP